MRKITLLLTLFLIAIQAQGQVLLTESFDSALNWTVAHTAGTSTVTGWSRVTLGTAPSCAPFSGAGMARFYSYNIATGNSYSLTSPGITFAGASYRVKFNMYRDSGYSTDADKIRVYYNTTASSTGGTLLGTVNRSIALAPVETADGWYSYSFDLPANVTGVGYISILATSAYGNNMFLDNVVVSQIQTNDAEMSSVNLAAVTATTGNTNISGNLKNVGANILDAVDLNWQVDSGTIYTQSLTGLNLAPGQTYAYSHIDQWNATPGLYSVKVWVSNPNGTLDNEASNDQITKSVSIASNSTTRLPLYEKFSSSTCNPCASFNGTYFSPFYTSNHQSFSFIDYQVNWPGTGDPYYTTEVGTRVAYYGVSGAPTLFVDAKDGTNFDTTLLQSDLTAASGRSAFFVLNATHTITGNDIVVNINALPYVTGTYKLQVAVVEKITTGNATSNGETSFKNVMMKMLPNASGTTLNCVFDQPMATQLQATLTGLHIEEMTDLAVVVFVQGTDKSIMQSSYSVDTALATTSFASNSKLKVFPNPTEGIVHIATPNPVDVEVTDITGKVLLTMKQVTSETSLNLTSFQKGIYLVKMKSGENEETQKIILK
jgi:hypothetical protein